MREREVDSGTVQFVSPYHGDATRYTGYRFVCGACGWTGRVMAHPQGAYRQADEHAGPVEALAAKDAG